MPSVENVRITESHLEVALKDGRQISAPLDWFPRLMSASPRDRANWEPCAAGHVTPNNAKTPLAVSASSVSSVADFDGAKREIMA